MDTTPLIAALDALRVRITRVLPAQIRDCLDLLTDDQIWWRPNEESNSVGNLVLHLSGSLNHYLNRNIGGFPYDRDREAEFAERREIPRDELLSIFNDMVAKAEQTFDALTPDRLGAPSPEPRQHLLLVQDIVSVAVHLSTHAGQIIWITKMQKGGGLDDLWMKAHREQGAWRKKEA